MSKKVEERRTFMFPILFLYRQFIELELKWIFLVYGKANRSERVPLLRTSGHDLIRLWGLIEPVLLKESLAEDRSDVDTVGEYIKQFHELDKTSQRFRYPIAKNLDPMLDKQQQINLPNLRSRMDELYHFFNGVDGKLNSLSEVNEDISEYFDDAAEGLEEI